MQEIQETAKNMLASPISIKKDRPNFAKFKRNPNFLLSIVTLYNYNITMTNITIRNIPDSVIEKLKILSEIERRSLNNELLIAIESGVKELEQNLSRHEIRVSPEIQSALWESLSGKWKDKKSKEKQIKEILDARTMGRDVSL